MYCHYIHIILQYYQIPVHTGVSREDVQWTLGLVSDLLRVLGDGSISNYQAGGVSLVLVHLVLEITMPVQINNLPFKKSYI